MCKTVKERLVAFIEFKGLSKNKFETLCGLSRRYVSNISKSIQPDMCERISLTFPELNIGWILTGEGEMLKPEPVQENPAAGVFVPQELVQMFTNMTEAARIQEENVARLTRMVDRLTGGEAAQAKRGIQG